jgi:hypothetical protein
MMENANMATRRGVLLGLLSVMLAGGAARAADPSAQAFLEGIYAHYKGKDTKGVAYSGRGSARYFTPSLVRLIDDDARAAKKRGDVPTLDGDPFVDAQEWDIAKFDIAVTENGAGKATGTVKFNNEGQDKEITIDLVKTKAGWRVDDLHAPSGSLRALFKKK